MVAEPVHTGHGAVALEGTAGVSSSVGLSQTLTLNGAWEPVLSFWYYPLTSDAEDRFEVSLSVEMEASDAAALLTSERVFTPALDVEGWHHQWYYVGARESALTGTVMFQFEVWNDGDGTSTTVYLDEVNLGATRGGPYKRYLPLTPRQF